MLLPGERVSGLIDECGTSMTVSGSVHSSTSVPPIGTFRKAFAARNTGCGQRKVVRPARADWREGLVTGGAIAPAFAAWLGMEAYKDRAN